MKPADIAWMFRPHRLLLGLKGRLWLDVKQPICGATAKRQMGYGGTVDLLDSGRHIICLLPEGHSDKEHAGRVPSLPGMSLTRWSR